MNSAQPIFRFLEEASAAGKRAALVTLTDVIGRGVREPGTHFAVREGGIFIGSLSGGCLEAAVSAEAERVLGNGCAEKIRFGVGSRFMDIRLPCGGGLDLLITPSVPLPVLKEAIRRLDARQPAVLALSLAGEARLVELAGAGPHWDGETFMAPHRPGLRLVIAGHGGETIALMRLAQAADIETIVYSPEPVILQTASSLGIVSHTLPVHFSGAGLDTDPSTAIVTLFHEHDLETRFLAWAVMQDTLMVGAMGSRETHRRRVVALENYGIPSRRLANLIGPIGVLPRARDPQTLAVSVLAQVVACYAQVYNAETSSSEPDRARPAELPALPMCSRPDGKATSVAPQVPMARLQKAEHTRQGIL
jgi:xanthine dehydrogenase accessory factor